MRILMLGWLGALAAIAACTTDAPCEQGTFQYACECTSAVGASSEIVCADDTFEAAQLAIPRCEEAGPSCRCECEPIGTECPGDRCKG